MLDIIQINAMKNRTFKLREPVPDNIKWNARHFVTTYSKVIDYYLGTNVVLVLEYNYLIVIKAESTPEFTEGNVYMDKADIINIYKKVEL